MSQKNSNEITLRVTIPDDEFTKFLDKNGFKETEKFTMDDYYFVPKDLNLRDLSIREIISKALILRDIKGNNTRIPKITYKIKDINEKGEILSQKAISCNVYDMQEAKDLINAIGYNEIMNIKESDIVYGNGDIEIGTKHIENFDNILIEIETDEKYDTVEKLIEKVRQINFPVDYSNYFVKKAEEYLMKILDRK